MAQPSPLALRMREYEAAYANTLPPNSFSVLRLDGRGFSNYTKNLVKPFDAQFTRDMNQTALALVQEISGVLCAYVASDEIFILCSDLEKENTQAWFGGKIAKQLSISAALASVTFTQLRSNQGPALFDARVFTLPDMGVVQDYFIFRQKDTMRNAVSMAARNVFSHRQLLGVSTSQAVEMLLTKGIDFHNDYPLNVRLGSVLHQVPVLKKFSFTHLETNMVHTGEAQTTQWAVSDAPLFGKETQVQDFFINSIKK